MPSPVFIGGCLALTGMLRAIRWKKCILDETKNEYKALRTEMKPRFDEPRQKARAKIRALLSAEQQQKFDAMVAQVDAQREGEQKKQR